MLRLKTQEEVWSLLLSLAKPDYIVAVNPCDLNVGFMPAISLAGAMLASERGGITLVGNYTVNYTSMCLLGYGTGDAGSGERGGDPDALTDEQEMRLLLDIDTQAVRLDNDIDAIVSFLGERGAAAQYLALAGSPAAVPMLYLKSPIWYENVQQEEKGEEYLATDFYYGDLDINLSIGDVEENFHEVEDALYTQELAVGRIVGPTLIDASALVVRSLAYQEYEYKPGPWEKKAEIVTSLMCGDSDNLAAKHQQIVFLSNGIVADQEHPAELWKFIVLDSAGRDAVHKMQDVAALIYDGHGYPDGWYWTWASTHDNENNWDRIGSEDIWELNMHAIPVFGACCLSSALDWPIVWNGSNNEQVTKPETFISQAFIHAGALAYIGATEESWGAFFGGLMDGNWDAWGLGDFDMPTMFWEHIFAGESIGTALNHAREDFYLKEWTDEASRPFARLCVMETVLYGEPAAMLTV